MPYLLDSNIFIQAKNLHYGFDFCPAFWEWLDTEHASGTVSSVEKVRDELIGGDDDLAEWAKARGDDFFLPPDSNVLTSLGTLSRWAGSGSQVVGGGVTPRRRVVAGLSRLGAGSPPPLFRMVAV